MLILNSRTRDVDNRYLSLLSLLQLLLNSTERFSSYHLLSLSEKDLISWTYL